MFHDHSHSHSRKTETINSNKDKKDSKKSSKQLESKSENDGSENKTVVDDEVEEEELPELSFYNLMIVLKSFFWPKPGPGAFLNRLRAISTWFFVIASKAFSIIAPLYLITATNKVSRGDLEGAINEIIFYALFSFLSKMMKELQRVAYLKVGQVAFVEISEHTFTHVLTLSFQWHLKKKMGTVMRAMNRGTTAAGTLVNYLFLFLLPAVGEMIAIAIIFSTLVLIFDKLVTFYHTVFVCIVIYVAITIKITLWRKKFREKKNAQDNNFHDKATDSLINFESVKLFTNEEYEVERFRESVEKYTIHSTAAQSSLSLLNTIQNFIIGVCVCLSLIFAARKIKEGKMNIGEFVAVNVYIINIFTPLSFLGAIYNAIVTALVDMRNLSQLLSEEPDVKDKEEAETLKLTSTTSSTNSPSFKNHSKNGTDPIEEDDIEMNLTTTRSPSSSSTNPLIELIFETQSENMGLKKINFQVGRGESLAIVGHTGSGKSTISRLLFRFYDPTEGVVEVDGIDIREVTQSSVRELIGVVPQDTTLFNETLLHNIQYGNPLADFEEVREAARSAQILDFIESLPEAWDTEVGERGLKLSGGERQRIAIARCLLKNPPIVLLDEATSALDSVTERSIKEALDALSEGRTVIIIAHRLSTIMHSSQIIVLKEGEIVERGRHEELVGIGVEEGEYAKMWTMQLEGHSSNNNNLDQNGSLIINQIEEEEETKL